MIYSGASSNKISDRELNNYKIAYEVALESIILLENDGTLPLTNKDIVLYGYGAKYTTYGGSGSGEVSSRYQVSIYEGLKNKGFNILNEDYFDDLVIDYHNQYKAWEENIKKGIKEVGLVHSLDYVANNQFNYQSSIEVKKYNTDIALYVIKRESSEGADRLPIKGDLYLSDDELLEIKTLNNLYQKVIIILNTPGIIENIKDIRGNAIVFAGYGGMEMGNALADIISGISPSAKLTYTWAKRDKYLINYKETEKEEFYKDSIYVGYRYFTSFDQEVIYPFGYGLSYSKFKIEYKDININNLDITLTFDITNIGNYKAKEVLLLYLSFPNNKIKREKLALCGFIKTKLLDINESEEVKISFNLANFYSYNDSKYILEKGLYKLSYGNILEPINLLYLNLIEDLIIKDNIYTYKDQVVDTKVDIKEEKLDLPIYDIVNPIYNKIDKEYHINEEAKNLLNKLSYKQKINLLIGATYIGKSYYKTFGAVGMTTSKYHKLGIKNIIMTDGPQGLNLKQKSKKPLIKWLNLPQVPKALTYTSVGFLFKEKEIKDSNKIYYQYLTYFPSALMLAQTFNLDLVAKEAKAIKEEMLEYNVHYILAPGINIIRDTLGGRCYEYYSEDPYLTALIGTNFINNIEDIKTHVCLKHYLCNNRETNRMTLNVNVSNKALREIYLKAFEYIINNTNLKGIMSSYNKVNGKYVNNNYDLITALLRNELNYKGLIMTDWLATGHDEAYHTLAIKSGHNLIMPGTPFIKKKVSKALKKKIITKEEIDNLAYPIIDIAINL